MDAKTKKQVTAILDKAYEAYRLQNTNELFAKWLNENPVGQSYWNEISKLKKGNNKFSEGGRVQTRNGHKIWLWYPEWQNSYLYVGDNYYYGNNSNNYMGFEIVDFNEDEVIAKVVEGEWGNYNIGDTIVFPAGQAARDLRKGYWKSSIDDFDEEDEDYAQGGTMSNYKIGDNIVFQYWNGDEKEGEITRKVDSDNWEVWYGGGAALVENKDILRKQTAEPKSWWMFGNGGDINKNDYCIEEVMKMVKRVIPVADHFIIDKQLIIVSKDELNVNDVELLNKQLEKLKVCHSVVNDNFEIAYNENYKTLKLGLKTDDFSVGQYAKGGNIYNYLVGTDFKYLGELHKVKKVENYSTYTILVTTENRRFRMDVLQEQGVKFADKPERKKRQPETPEQKRRKNAFKIKQLQYERKQLLIDMEQEAEAEGGPIANRYGTMLNKIDKQIAQLSGQDYFATGGDIDYSSIEEEIRSLKVRIKALREKNTIQSKKQVEDLKEQLKHLYNKHHLGYSDSFLYEKGGSIKSIKDLNNYLTHKKPGFNYHYVIGDYKFEINEFNDKQGWALNTYKKYNNDYHLIDSYGYKGFSLRECKNMILTEIEQSNIKYAKGGSIEDDKKPDKRMLNKIATAIDKVWDKIGAQSGGQIRADKKLQAEYAKLSMSEMNKLNIKKNSLTRKDYDHFSNSNNHLLNEFLIWNDFYTSKFADIQKKQLVRLYKEYPNGYCDPSIVKVVSSSDKYIPHSKIKSLTVLIDGKEVKIKGEDVLNGVNL
jgi:hypothetical protein